MDKKGILIVVSGFSGAGKGTLMKKLLEDYSGYALSVSATTRAPREGELHGKDYFFISRDEFTGMIRDNRLYEYTEYQNNYYGTPRAYVDEMLASGKDVILEIEVMGAENIKKQFPDTVLVFVTPPSAEELRRRLLGRGSETPEKVKGRLMRALQEADYMDRYDYILVNDDIDACVKELHNLICTEHLRMSRRSELCGRMKRELESLNGGREQ